MNKKFTIIFSILFLSSLIIKPSGGCSGGAANPITKMAKMVVGSKVLASLTSEEYRDFFWKQVRGFLDRNSIKAAEISSKTMNWFCENSLSSWRLEKANSLVRPKIINDILSNKSEKITSMVGWKMNNVFIGTSLGRIFTVNFVKGEKKLFIDIRNTYVPDAPILFSGPITNLVLSKNERVAFSCKNQSRENSILIVPTQGNFKRWPTYNPTRYYSGLITQLKLISTGDQTATLVVASKDKEFTTLKSAKIKYFSSKSKYKVSKTRSFRGSLNVFSLGKSLIPDNSMEAQSQVKVSQNRFAYIDSDNRVKFIHYEMKTREGSDKKDCVRVVDGEALPGLGKPSMITYLDGVIIGSDGKSIKAVPTRKLFESLNLADSRDLLSCVIHFGHPAAKTLFPYDFERYLVDGKERLRNRHRERIEEEEWAKLEPLVRLLSKKSRDTWGQVMGFLNPYSIIVASRSSVAMKNACSPSRLALNLACKRSFSKLEKAFPRLKESDMLTYFSGVIFRRGGRRIISVPTVSLIRDLCSSKKEALTFQDSRRLFCLHKCKEGEKEAEREADLFLGHMLESIVEKEIGEAKL